MQILSAPIRTISALCAIPAICVLTLAFAGCSWLPTPTSSSSQPTENEPSATASNTPSATTVYFVVNQPTSIRLISETLLVSTGSDIIHDVLAGLIDGSIQPTDPDYVNLWGHGSALLTTVRAGALLTVDLHLGTLTVGSEAEARAIGQLVWTATELDRTIKSVGFLVDGVAVESLAGHLDASSPFVRGPATDVLSPVQITSPAEGFAVTSPVTATGLACTFEAHVAWALTSGGQPVATGTTLAAEACPTRSQWQLALGDLAPGNYQLTVTEYSARDGSVASIDSKRFIVTG